MPIFLSRFILDEEADAKDAHVQFTENMSETADMTGGKPIATILQYT
jgi:hypothetical protein